MKKLAVLFLIAAALLCFQREAPAAPLTDGQARTVIQQLVRRGHRIEDLWSYEAVFKKGTEPQQYDPDNVKYYPVDTGAFPYKTAKALVADTRRTFSRKAIDEMGIFKLAPRYKDVDGAPCALCLGQDGDPHEMKWFTQSAVVMRQTPSRVIARVRRVENRSGRESWARLELVMEDGIWKLDQSSYADGAPSY